MHPLLNHIIGDALAELGKGESPVPFVTVVTDLGSAHAAWFSPRARRIYLPTEKSRTVGKKFCSPKNLSVKGIPLRKAFWGGALSDEERARKKTSLHLTSGTCVLLMQGGSGENIVPLAHDIGVMMAARKDHRETTLIVITGRNEGAKDELKKMRWYDSWKPLILGYVDDIEDYMSVADVFVTKAGHAAIAEALALELPILATGHVVNEEEGNISLIEGSASARLKLN